MGIIAVDAGIYQYQYQDHGNTIYQYVSVPVSGAARLVIPPPVLYAKLPTIKQIQHYKHTATWFLKNSAYRNYIKNLPTYGYTGNNPYYRFPPIVVNGIASSKGIPARNTLGKYQYDTFK